MNGSLWRSPGEAQGAHQLKGRLQEGAESQPPHSPSMPGLGGTLGASPPFTGEGCQPVGCAQETPQPLPANPTSPPPPPPQQQQHHHHHTHKKIGYILNKAIRFLIRGLGCSV